MLRDRVEPSIVSIVVHVVKQTTIVPEMTSPQERQLKEQMQEIP
jgi:hypothetical protein